MQELSLPINEKLIEHNSDNDDDGDDNGDDDHYDDDGVCVPPPRSSPSLPLVIVAVAIHN